MMRMIFQSFALFAALLYSGQTALAQSSPNLQYGQIPTPAQWNSYFAAKQDYLGIGTTGQCLVIVSGKPAWGPCSSGVTNVATGGFVTGGPITTTGTIQAGFLGGSLATQAGAL